MDSLNNTPSQDPPSSSPAATPPENERRYCRQCRRRMSTLDLHCICSSCREVKCDLGVRCPECKDWSTSQMEDYIKVMKNLESKLFQNSDFLKPAMVGKPVNKALLHT